MESLQHRSSSNVGAVEIAASFTCRSDLDLVLRAAKAVGWAPALKSDLNRLLVPNSSGVLMPIDSDDLLEDSLTTCITVTNAWLPRSLLALPGSDEVNKNAHIFLRYKFYDKDTVISTVCPVANASEKKTFKQLDMFPVKLAHRKSFLCRATQPLIWYLREEILEIQVWLSFSRSSRSRKRPFAYDKLLGTAMIDMSSVLVGGLHRQQHISGLYPLYKAGVDDLGDASLRVYLSANPGDHTQPLDAEELDETSTSLSSTEAGSTPGKDGECTVSKKRKSKIDFNHFSAIVSVERAMHLASLPVADPQVVPSCYVTYPVADGDKTVETTKLVPRLPCPVWDDAREVKLDRKVLDKDHGSLLFRVWQRDGNAESRSKDGDESQETNDKVIGFATVDVSLLLAGFRAVNGWYNVLDIHGHCQGQIKVAITPTDPMHLNQQCDPEVTTTAQTSSSPHKGILHSVPLWGPVETPSGSMYYPGIAKASQDKNNCSPTKNLPPVSSSHLPAPNKATASSVAIDSIPRRALFQHDAHSSLQTVLQKQMMELDQIKQNFQKRLEDAHGADADKLSDNFVPPLSVSFPAAPHLASFPSTSIMVHPSKAVTSDEALPQSTVGSSPNFLPLSTPTSSPSSHISEILLPTGTERSNPKLIPSDTLVPSGVPLKKASEDSELLTQLNTSTPEFTKSVHLSLFKSNKMPEYNDGVLSDNDLSDVEFVQPRHLNDDEDLPDARLRSHDAEDGSREKNSEKSFSGSLSVTPPQTGPSEHPELDNTSLWLSASTSQMETTSKTDVGGEEEEDAVSKQPHASHSPVVIKIDQRKERNGEDENNSNEITETMSPNFELVTEMSSSFADEDVNDENEDDSGSDSTIKNEDDVEDPDPLSTDSFEHRNRNYSEEDKAVTVKFDANSEDERFIPKEQNQNVEDEVHESVNATPALKQSNVETMSAVDPPSNSCFESEKDISTLSKPHTSSLPSSSTLDFIPSFFPPRQDLLASMRALQTITTEQKVF